VEVREVKANRVVADNDPQQIRLHDAITLINERHGIVDGAPSAIVRCAEPFETHLDQLPQILQRARRHGSHPPPPDNRRARPRPRAAPASNGNRQTFARQRPGRPLAPPPLEDENP
jgi:hypothetical protein